MEIQLEVVQSTYFQKIKKAIDSYAT